MKLLRGDCRERLQELDADSIDAVVTDPPYGLSKEPDIAEVLTHWLAGDDYQHGSGGFMGASWDSFVPGPTYWREVFRVMKPGAHLVAFGGTRTYDLLVIAIRMAGFEIRDQLAWHHGQGFPKGKSQLKPAMEPIVLARKPFKGSAKKCVEEHGTGALNIEGCRLTSGEPRSVGTKKMDHAVSGSNGVYGKDARVGRHQDYDARKPAGRWPANVVLSHHPDCELRGTKRVKAITGTAAGKMKGKVDTTVYGLETKDGEARWKGSADAGKKTGFGDPDGKETVEDWGCVPSCAIRLLDEQSGMLTTNSTGSKSTGDYAHKGDTYGDGKSGGGQTYGTDKGGASRFFMTTPGDDTRFRYQAKATKKERHKGCEALYWTKDGKPLTETEWSKLPEKERRQGNIHVTVKPVALMRWLVRLVTPPGGKVLDPFMGSGSTGIAAKEEGFDFIGVELEESSHTIAEARIEAAEAGTQDGWEQNPGIGTFKTEEQAKAAVKKRKPKKRKPKKSPAIRPPWARD